MESYFKKVALIGVLVLSVVSIWLILRGEKWDRKRPNVVIIVADDLGFNDVSFHGSDQIPTPNIDALAYNGVIMNKFYTAPLCSPSRASLMTGKYPSNIGMQHFVILPEEPWGLSLKDKIMPQFFKEAGYQTHLVGKWHLGYFQQQYAPTRRGFDTHFGYLGPHIDYYNYTFTDPVNTAFSGYDMRKNLDVNYDIEPNTYVTSLLTDESVNIIKNHNDNDPLFLMLTHLAPHSGNENAKWQAPQEEVEKFYYIEDPEKRVYAAMVSLLDKSVGRVVKAIGEKGMLDNTIIVFISDNGAPTLGVLSTKGSNFPLRGQKHSPWEGSSRAVGLIYSPLLKKNARVSHDWIHISDLLPTLTSAAGIPIPSNLTLDGIDQWKTLSEGKTSVRREVLSSLDDVLRFGSYIHDGWKLVNGTTGRFQEWYGNIDDDKLLSDTQYASKVLGSSVGRTIKKYNYFKKIKSISGEKISSMRHESTVFCDPHGNSNRTACLPNSAPCLFELYRDPCELNNLAEKYPKILLDLQGKFQEFVLKAVPSRRRPIDPLSYPNLHDNTLTWWQPDGIID